MTTASIFYYLLFIALFVSIRLGLYKLFEKVGEQGWKAFIPVYSDVVWLKMISKPAWWIVLTLIPIVRTLVKVSMDIDMAKVFGKHKFGQQALAVIVPYIYYPIIGFDKETQFLGMEKAEKLTPRKSGLREWGDAFLFAGMAALLIRTFFIEAFMIPTSSMERTLMAGDFLFVSKFHYGARLPMVPLSVPFIHNKISVGTLTMPSYIGALRLPYFRLPGLGKINRFDIVVFNYPAHDISPLRDGLGTVKPISMKENYVKRCVGMPGDKLEIRHQQLYINDKPSWNPPYMQYEYRVQTNGNTFLERELKTLGFRALPRTRAEQASSINPNYYPIGSDQYTFFMPDSIAKTIKSFRFVTKVDTFTYEGVMPLYPSYLNEKNQLFSFSIDNFGPINIPKKGMTVSLADSQNVSLYYRCITAYEGHELEMKNGKVFIDGAQADNYTFAMDYYWMMGDNRHNSEDSRWWGFVPEDHVVGRPIMIFFSFEKDFGIRWNRIGTGKIH